jgi:hypothetical protein
MAIYEINLLHNDLKRFNFGHMPHDVIGAVFEKLFPNRNGMLWGNTLRRKIW